MSVTSAPTHQEVVGAPSSFEVHFGAVTEDVDFLGLLEEPIFGQGIGETYCDTYLRVADASIQLEVSQKMQDYLIDINIYRYVLRSYLLKVRKYYLNKSKY